MSLNKFTRKGICREGSPPEMLTPEIKEEFLLMASQTSIADILDTFGELKFKHDLIQLSQPVHLSLAQLTCLSDALSAPVGQKLIQIPQLLQRLMVKGLWQ
jgi:hypothetical protein